MEKAMSTNTKKHSPIQEFIDLPDAEKERIYQSVDREIPFSETRPLTPAQRKLWAQAKKKMGRPLKGTSGVKVISLSVEKGLLARADKLAKAKGVTRASLVAAGINEVLKKPSLVNPAA